MTTDRQNTAILRRQSCPVCRIGRRHAVCIEKGGEIGIDRQATAVDQKICVSGKSRSGNGRTCIVKGAELGVGNGGNIQLVDKMVAASNGQFENAACRAMTLSTSGCIALGRNRAKPDKYTSSGHCAAGEIEADVTGNAAAAKKTGTISCYFRALGSKNPAVEK